MSKIEDYFSGMYKEFIKEATSERPTNGFSMSDKPNTPGHINLNNQLPFLNSEDNSIPPCVEEEIIDDVSEEEEGDYNDGYSHIKKDSPKMNLNHQLITDLKKNTISLQEGVSVFDIRTRYGDKLIDLLFREHLISIENGKIHKKYGELYRCCSTLCEGIFSPKKSPGAVVIDSHSGLIFCSFECHSDHIHDIYGDD